MPRRLYILTTIKGLYPPPPVTYDLTSTTLSNVNVYGNADNVTLLINNADTAGVQSFGAGGLGDKLVTAGSTLDLSHTTVSGFTVASTNALGTTFTVGDLGTALQIAGGSGHDTLIAQGFTLTAAQRTEIFATSSIETITDQTGTYTVGNAVPTISGTVSGLTTTSEAPVKPFAHATVGDANVGATDTLTITLGGAGGTLADGVGFSSLTTVGAGVYRLSGTAAAITSELDALVFTPIAGAPGSVTTTTFTLNNVSNPSGTSATDNTTTVTDTDLPGTVVLFQGSNGTGKRGLWETNGTTAGTFELAAIIGANPSGLQPSNLISFDGQALFEGSDTSGGFGLWTTNGTATGTQEVAGTSGLSPSDLTVFNGQVLFDGTSGGISGLWTTNGTASGTFLVTNSARSPYDLTVFNGQVLFDGTSGGVSGLWTTNGTALGTVLVTNSAGNPFDFTVLGSQVLFNATSGGRAGLWATNGTAAGTHQIAVAGAEPSFGLNPSYLTVLDANVLFSGVDTSSNTGLWNFNGTTATEVTGITDIHGVAVADLHPKFLTAFGGKVLFNGLDSDDDEGLWVTNGTAVGTHEILATAPGGGGPLDPVGLDPTGFELFNGKVLFNGVDANGHTGLWETDGTAAGTDQVSVTGVASTGLSPFDLTSLVNVVNASPTISGTGSGLDDNLGNAGQAVRPCDDRRRQRRRNRHADDHPRRRGRDAD